MRAGMGAEVQWRARVLVTFACTLASCSNDLGDLIAKPVEDSGVTPRAEPEDEEPPWLPALPDEDRRDECEECAKENCKLAHDNCLEDDACTALLGCKGKCDDPACLAECEAEHGFSAWYEDLWLCTFGSCGTECGAGQNWGCVGKYDWPPAEGARFEVTVDFDPHTAFRSTGGLVAVGARARYCPDRGDLTCGFGSPSVSVDATNSVALEVQSNFGGGAATGWVELESASPGFYGWRDRLYGQPLFRSAIVRAYPLPALFYRFVAGGWLDLESTWLSTNVGDCVGWPAIGVRHSLPDHPETNPCHLNLGGAALCNPGAEGSLAALELDAATLDGPLRVQVQRVDTSEVVAERIVHGRPAWRTQATLFPRSREQ